MFFYHPIIALKIFLKNMWLLFEAFLGGKYAIKVLIKKNKRLGLIFCYSPFQRNEYCKIIKSYFSKNLEKSEKFLLVNSQKNPRILFLLYNFFKKNKQLDQVKVLDDYFYKKHLFPIDKIDSYKELYIDNLTTLGKRKYVQGQELVSVIITVYNCDALIYYAVMSIINQTYKNIEIIIVNDGSTDDTILILEDLKNRFSNIKLVSITNSGTYVARNIGLIYTTGDYITFHDADDWAHPQRIYKHLEIHRKHNDCTATISHLARVTPDGYFYSPHIYPVDRNCMVSLMFTREVFQQLGYFRVGRFGNDTEYFERIKTFIKGEVYFIEKVLTICAQRPNSLTTTPLTSNEIGKNKRRMHQMKRWRKWHTLYLKKHKIPYVDFKKFTGLQ